jgi:hypothetical protein
MRPRKPQTTGEGDLFRARLEQIINMGHELVQLASKIDWDWIDGESRPLYRRARDVEEGAPVPVRFITLVALHRGSDSLPRAQAGLSGSARPIWRAPFRK